MRDLGLGGQKNRHRARRAFVYYKTDPIFSASYRESFRHTNDSEIFEIVKVLNELGFVVDLVDREALWTDVEPLLSENYEIYFANAAGNSAPLHVRINDRINASCRIYFAAGPEPEFSNALVHRRHEEFDTRTGAVSVRRRILNDLNFPARLKGVDAIFYIGNEFSSSSFSRVSSASQYRILPSSSPLLHLDLDGIENKSASSFMYLGGNGLICKGLDLVLEAFDGLHNLSLDVCGPEGERDFWEHYLPLMRRNPQVRFHGFVDVNGSAFRKLSERAAYNLFPSCSEGCATSVITAMRRGVVPVVTPESGVDIGTFGVSILDTSVKALRALILKLANESESELRRRVVETYMDSEKYSIDRFRSAIRAAFIQTMQTKNLI